MMTTIFEDRKKKKTKKKLWIGPQSKFFFSKWKLNKYLRILKILEIQNTTTKYIYIYIIESEPKRINLKFSKYLKRFETFRN